MPTLNQTPLTYRRTAGLVCVLLGFVTMLLSTLWDGGFMHGFFQGATIALMVLGAFFIGSALWWRPKDAVDEGESWLPSRDGAADGRRQQ